MACVALLVAAASAAGAGTVTVNVSGYGTVVDDVGGINCTTSAGGTSGDCSEAYADTQECDPQRHPPCFDVPPFVTLTGSAAAGWSIANWAGCDDVSGASCTMEVTANRTVTLGLQATALADVALTAPAPGAFVTGTTQLAATAGNNNGIQRIDFLANGGKIGEDTTAPFQLAFDTSLRLDGPVSIAARAVDAVGNAQTSAARTVTIDNTAPTLSIDGPSGEAFGPGSTQTWTFGAADTGSGVASVQCRIDADPLAPCTNPFAVSNLPEGSHTFLLRATDNVGKVRSETRTFTIDATAPTLSIDGPSGETFGPGSTQTWTFAVNDPGSGVASVQCHVDGDPFAACTSPFAVSNLPEGNHTFFLQATDAVGNVGSATRTFAIDATPPVTTIATGPADGATVTSGTVTFGFGADDAAATFACRIYVTGTTPPAFAPCDTAGTETADLPDGSYVFEVRATDPYGNAGAAVSRSFTVDTATAPPTGDPSTSPTPGADASASPSPSPAPSAGPNVEAQAFRLTLAKRFKTRGARTRVKRLVVSGIPDGAAVSVACKGGRRHGCPFKQQSFEAAGGALDLRKTFAKRLRRGARITITVTPSGAASQTISISFRRGKPPTVI